MMTLSMNPDIELQRMRFSSLREAQAVWQVLFHPASWHWANVPRPDPQREAEAARRRPRAHRRNEWGGGGRMVDESGRLSRSRCGWGPLNARCDSLKGSLFGPHVPLWALQPRHYYPRRMPRRCLRGRQVVFGWLLPSFSSALPLMRRIPPHRGPWE